MWKSIKGYKGIYEVSDSGKVKSLARTMKRKGSNGNSYTVKEKILKPALCDGYCVVNLTNKNGNKRTKKIHRLVAEAFIPNPNNLSDVDHIDNCKTNNKLSNLQWLSSGDNTRKSFDRYGSQHGRAKLDERKVIIIKYVLHHKLARQGVLANLYNVSQSRICEANTGKIWGHVKERSKPIFCYCKTWAELLLVYGS